MIGRLTLSDFRNHADALILPDHAFVLLTGDNGAGKTNILEAVSMLAPGRGLRGAALGAMARQEGAGGFGIAAEVDGGTRLTDAQWTIGSLLRWTTDYLRQHGSITPRLDAEVLLAEVHGCQRINLYIAYEELASDETRVAYRELVRRRAEGTPVAYLVGRREFYSHQFRVTPDVLIPRPETEFVLVALLDLVKDSLQGSKPMSQGASGHG